MAKMLDRTLIVPPVWLGHAIPWIPFDKLYNRVREARKYGLEHCKDIPQHESTPWECLPSYWDYTLVSWDLLVDLEAVARKQPLIDGWDASYDWFEKELGINLEKEAAFIKDAVNYDYRIFDDATDPTPLGKFARRLDVDTLKEEYGQIRLLHFGSVYGTSRLTLSKPENRQAHSFAKQSMVFKHQLLDSISTIIADRLGGQTEYLGLHIRLGDGSFKQNALKNAEDMFDELVGQKLGLEDDLIAGLKKESRASHSLLGKEGGHPKRDIAEQAAEEEPSTTTADRLLNKRATGKATGRNNKDPHADLPLLPTIRFRSDSPLHPSLTCRGALHADPRLYKLNIPIFIATDSKSPSTDPALRLFFDTFPCVFTLEDFLGSYPTIINADLPIEELQKLQAMRNKEDGVPLASFFYPILDAMIAAKGRDMLGTNAVGDNLHEPCYIS